MCKRFAFLIILLVFIRVEASVDYFISGDLGYGWWHVAKIKNYTEEPDLFLNGNISGNISCGFMYRYFRFEAGAFQLISSVEKVADTGYRDKDFNVKAVLFNVFHDCKYFNLIVVPFVGLGVGFFHIKSDPFEFGALNYDFAVNQNAMGYNIKAGLLYSINKNLDVFLQYGFMQTQKVFIHGTSDIRPTINLVSLGFKYVFN